MSYCKLGLVIIFTSFWLCTSCEDTKKGDTPTPVPTVKIDKEAISSEEKKQAADTLIDAVFPKLTTENAIDFLTEYGKENQETRVRIKTQHGDIDIELYTDTPIHRANFIYLIKQKVFDNSFFHRVVPNFIIQGGNADTREVHKKRAQISAGYLLPAEINTRKHTYGSVSGAKEYRKNPNKKTFPFEFFIFLGPPTSTSHLDGNYTIFGKVTKGMDVVEKIANLPTDPDGDWPTANVFITAEVLD